MNEVLFGNAVMGDTFRACLVENVARAHIAQYAGASGEFNDVHIDEPFAVDSGRPSVIAHGMLTMGLIGSFLTSLVGHGAIMEFGGRFVAPVVPGDTVHCLVCVDAVDGRSVSLKIEAFTEHGTVFRGTARTAGKGNTR